MPVMPLAFKEVTTADPLVFYLNGWDAGIRLNGLSWRQLESLMEMVYTNFVEPHPGKKACMLLGMEFPVGEKPSEDIDHQADIRNIRLSYADAAVGRSVELSRGFEHADILLFGEMINQMVEVYELIKPPA